VVARFPADGAKQVSPDTHLVLTFACRPSLGSKGKIHIYDAADDRLVDSLDLSIPPGPTEPNQAHAPYTPAPYEYLPGRPTNADTKPGTPSGLAVATPDTYQLTIIGGFTDAFHFYPVIIHDNVATITLHHNLLTYDTTYYVQIEPGVLTLADGSFPGITGTNGWRFTTKRTPPPDNADRLVVSSDGTGDFSTVQGAVDFITDDNPRRTTIFISNGTYEEIVHFRSKSNITFLGENRDKVVICYANNEVFNPHPANITTNEVPGTFPSRRAVFMADNSRGIHLVNLTLRSLNDTPAQAEGLLMMGEHNIVSHVTVEGSGDALQVNGSVHLTDSRVVGYGDNVLGRGPAFFKRCELVSSFGPHMWIRNTAANHGNVFVNSIFRTVGSTETVIARAPANHGKTYPYAEAVLINCALEGVSPEGWGPIGGDTTNVHYWEYGSTSLVDGTPVDVSRRHPASRQLVEGEDAEILASYTDPGFVLGGWTPAMAPLLLSQPVGVTVEAGQTVALRVEVAAVPDATYQWYKNGEPIKGATGARLRIGPVAADDAASYTVTAGNEHGSVHSDAAVVTVR